MDKVNTVIYAFKLVEKRVDRIEEASPFVFVGYYRADHLVVARHHCVELVHVSVVAVQRQLRRGEQFVRYAAEGAHYYDDRLFA